MPILLLILASALWGLSFPLVKALHLEQASRLPGASSLFLASWMQTARFGISAAILLPFLFRLKRPSSLEIRQGFLLALWGGAGMWLQTDALAYTEASTSAFLTQAYCILLPLWACLRIRRLPGAKVVIATLLILVGGGILSGIRPGHFRLGRGEIETLAAALIFTFQILTLENSNYRGNRGSMVSLIMFLGIAVLFVPVTVMTAPAWQDCLTAGASVPAVVIIGSLALFCSIGAYGIMNSWQSRVSATEAGLIYTSEPVFASIYVLFLPVILGSFVGTAYPNEALSAQLLIGGGLVLIANILMQWRRKPHMPPIGPIP